MLLIVMVDLRWVMHWLPDWRIGDVLMIVEAEIVG